MVGEARRVMVEGRPLYNNSHCLVLKSIVNTRVTSQESHLQLYYTTPSHLNNAFLFIWVAAIPCIFDIHYWDLYMMIILHTDSDCNRVNDSKLTGCIGRAFLKRRKITQTLTKPNLQYLWTFYTGRIIRKDLSWCCLMATISVTAASTVSQCTFTWGRPPGPVLWGSLPRCQVPFRRPHFLSRSA